MINDPHRALMIALKCYLGPLYNVSANTHDWWSATFTGMRHEVWFVTSASAALIAALPDIDLPMRDHFVADLAIVGLAPLDGGMAVAIEVLTIRSEDEPEEHGVVSPPLRGGNHDARQAA